MAYHPTGCTIQLTAGTYITKPLVANNFHGVLRGQGMDVTSIEALTPLPELSDLVTFIDGDITISDMSFKVTAYQPVVPCDPNSDFCGLLALVLVTGHTSANASFQRVAFEGGPGPDWGFGAYNLYAGLLFEGYDVGNPSLKGTFQMFGCRSRNSSENVRVYQVADSQITLTIGGSPENGNVVENDEIGIYVANTARSSVEVSYNRASACGAFACLLMDQSPDYAHDPSQFLVEHNTVTATGDFASGIYVDDYTQVLWGTEPSKFAVSHNDVTLENSAEGLPYEGVGTYGTAGATISTNRVSGAATFGIDATGAAQCLILGNNVQQFNADFAAIGLLADYYPDPTSPTLTTNCTVVGGSKDSFYDEGVDNKIVGVNNMQGNPPGPAIQEAMKRKHEMMKDVRRMMMHGMKR